MISFFVATTVYIVDRSLQERLRGGYSYVSSVVTIIANGIDENV
jgi:hypothetical protein